MTNVGPSNEERAASSASDVPRENARTILFQFVVFPLGVVVIGVAIFLFFGRMASEEHSIPDHLSQIKNGSPHERWQAAYELSKSLKRGEAARHPDLAPQVMAVYRDAKDEDPRVRRYLSMVLGNIGDRRATPLLLEALGDRDVETRIYALLALAQLRDPSTVPHVIGAASDGEKDVRKTALYALGQLGDPRGVEALAAAASDPTADVRFNAGIALARLGDRRAIGVLREMLDRERLDLVSGMRPDQKEDAIVAAISAYASLLGAEAAPELRRLAEDDPSLRVQAAAKEALQPRR